MYVCTYGWRKKVCMYVRMYVCTYVCMYVCMYVRMYVYRSMDFTFFLFEEYLREKASLFLSWNRAEK